MSAFKSQMLDKNVKDRVQHIIDLGVFILLLGNWHKYEHNLSW